MKTMMKIMALVLAIVMVAGCLAACGSDETKPTEPEVTTKPTTPTEPAPTDPAPTDPPDDGKKEYKVTVVDAEGNPVEGVFVQVCHTGSCFGPFKTDSNGIAMFRLTPGSEYYGTVSGSNNKAYFEDKFEVTLVYNPPVAE